MSKHRTVIFDLDGTLADTWPIALEVVRGMKIIDHDITEADYERLRNMTIKDIMKDLKVPLIKLPTLLVRGRAALTERITEVPLFPGMKATLNQLAKDNHLYVMSSNSLDNVQKFLELHHIENSFEEIHGGVGVFSKAKMLRRIMKERGLDFENTYYVGDEVRDVEAAKKAGVKSVAVTWGFNGEKILREYSPNYVVRTPAELKKVLAGAKK